MVLSETIVQRVKEIQKYLLAGFIDDGGVEEFKDVLKKEYFGAYAKIYDFIVNNGNSKTPDFWEVVGVDYVDISDRYSGDWKLNVFKYIKELITLYFKDKLDKESEPLARLEEMKTTFGKLNEIQTGFTEEGSLEQGLLELEEEIEENMKSDQIGFKTGIGSLDDNIDGLIKGKVYRLAGYSNTGKSKLSYSITNSVLKQKATVAYFSLEVTRTEVLLNLTSNFFGIDYHSLRKGKEIIDFGKYSTLPIRIYDNVSRIEDIERIVFSTKPDVVIIDYVQLVKLDGKSEYEQLNDYARRMKGLSKRAKVAVFDLSQVSNDGFKYVKGDKISMKGSGELVNAADVGMVLVSDVESGELKLHIAKHRYGRKGAEINLMPDFSKGVFKDLGVF